MRALFTTLPGAGHLHPLLPFARGLRERGHDVAFAVSEPFRAEVAAAGFAEHHAVGTPWTTAEMPVRFPGVGERPPGPDRYAYARAHVFAHDAALDVLDDLSDLIERWTPDVVVRDAAEFGAVLAAERAGIPHAMVRTDSGSASYAERTILAARLDAARAVAGLSPDPTAESAFRYLQLSAAPPVLDDPPATRPPTWHHVRPAIGSGGDGPAWLHTLGGRGPVVYATLGTINKGADLLAAIVDALAGEPVDVVVSTGRVDPAALGPQPDHVHLASWLDQAAILPRCDAVVTHGGYGTVAAAIAHAVPLVLLPISADQPMNATRCVGAGLGVAIEPAARTAGSIRDAVRTILHDGRYAAAASAAAADAAAQPPLDTGLDLLERLADRRAVLSGSCR